MRDCIKKSYDIKDYQFREDGFTITVDTSLPEKLDIFIPDIKKTLRRKWKRYERNN